MGYIDVAGAAFVLPDGRELFSDVSFRVGEGSKVALVGPNGAGKTTLLRMVAGDLPIKVGSVARFGGLGVMRQFIGMVADETTLAQLAFSLMEPQLRAAGERLVKAEAVMRAQDTVKSQVRYAEALTGVRRGRRVRRGGSFRHRFDGHPRQAVGGDEGPSNPDTFRRRAETVRTRAPTAR